MGLKYADVPQEDAESMQIEKYLKEIINHRHSLHKIPEVGLELSKTKEYVNKILKGYGLNPYKVGPGLVVDFGKAPYIALRADMDALPIKELRDSSYKSKNDGFMHACGHDAHTAVLLEIAHYLCENPPSHGIRLIFQPGEEGYFGAKLMVEADALNDVEVILGEHVGAGFNAIAKTGLVISKKGPFMASADSIYLTFKGRGTHGSIPHTGIDPIVAAANYVMAIYTMRSREVNQTHPAVISIGEIHSGTTHNIIPTDAKISGTVRAVLNEDRKYIAKRLEEIAQSIAKTYKNEVDFEYKWMYPPLQNTPSIVSILEKMVKDNGISYLESPEPIMGAEDFTYYLEKVPGAFFFVNTGNTEKGINAPNHSPYFDIDEDALWIPFYIFLKFIKEWTNKHI